VNLPLFLSDLYQRGVRLSADGDRLRCQAPTGVLTAAVTAELQRRKQEILELLGAAHAVAHQPAIVPLQPRGTRPAVFAIAGHNGDVFAYRELVDALGPDQPFFGLQPPGLDAGSAPLASVADLAAYFAAQIVAFDRGGPHIIAGYCAGGTIAFELAQQLAHRGVGVGFVAMFGCPYPRAFSQASRMRRRLRGYVRSYRALEKGLDKYRYVRESMRRRTARPAAPEETDPVLRRRAMLEQTTLAAILDYRPVPFSGRLDLFLPCREWALDFQTHHWRRFAAEVHEYEGPAGCEMPTMLRAPHHALFARFLQTASTRR